VPPKIALVLGGGATRGFAHVGIFKGEALGNSVNRATQDRRWKSSTVLSPSMFPASRDTAKPGIAAR